ncbi:MAG TPA: bifunctional 5,10-methylenetetrahydrofolate dehydrogenase/5,10-methenyltetrahydrofolate cyclohydrolase [candidate division Zixibacteria bacterium]|nr:bifunctional 5,10-methylenetetrahydrofolate dehydrogenase/5,10-methenyltetrahydrofolate cyclohydrolase [candidate division Zixibacteria bacterium]
MMKILSGKKVAESIFEKILKKIQLLDESPRLLSVIIGDNPAAVSYARAKGRKAGALGAEFKVLDFSATLSQREIERQIRAEIKSWDPDGIILEKPVPDKFDFDRLVSLIPPVADIDCQRLDNLGRLMAGKPKYFPATPKAVVEILKFYEIPPEGKHITIVGRSLTVGLPLSVMLLSKSEMGNATVTVCHSRTPDISKHTRRADIVVLAAGKPGLLTADMVTKKAIVIDVGTTYVNGKLHGDADFEPVSQKVRAITPVPGGVGPVTTACLFQNLLDAALTKRKILG